ncbi:MAG: ribulose-phosphate 3-epimerase [Victivallaceae bacterium]|nr:ribulose-phosphate 3-epimerase [Victivallaceae bacterium]
MHSIADIPRDEVVVAPSLLAADFNRLGEECAAAAAAGAKVLHLDVMDGHFVPNISFGVPVIKSLRKQSDLFFDAHLMISHPKQYAKVFSDAGSDLITFHLESDDDPDEVIDELKRLGVAAGISLKPGTSAEKIFPYLDRVDLVLVMTVEPGFGGQHFMHEMMPKLAAIRREIKRRALPVILEVDGGVAPATAEEVAAHGGNWLVAGTAVFRAPEGMKNAVEKLKSAYRVFDRETI